MADYLSALLGALGGEREKIYQRNPYLVTGTSLMQEPVDTGVVDPKRPWINALFRGLSKAGGGLMRGYGLGQAEREYQDYAGKANDLIGALSRGEAYAPVEKKLAPLASQLKLVDALKEREAKEGLQQLVAKEQAKSLYGSPKLMSTEGGVMVYNPDGTLLRVDRVGGGEDSTSLAEVKQRYQDLITGNRSLDEATKKAGISSIIAGRKPEDIQNSYEKLLRTANINLEDPDALKSQKENYKSLVMLNNDLDDETKIVGSNLIDSATNSKELAKVYNDYAKEAKERVKAKAKQRLLNIPDWQPGPQATTDPQLIRAAFKKKDNWNLFLRGVEKLKASLERGGQAFTGDEYLIQKEALAQMDRAKKEITGAGAALTKDEIRVYFADVPELFANPTTENRKVAYNLLKGIDFKDQVERLKRSATEELEAVRTGIGYLPAITIAGDEGGGERAKRIQEIRNYVNSKKAQ